MCASALGVGVCPRVSACHVVGMAAYLHLRVCVCACVDRPMRYPTRGSVAWNGLSQACSMRRQATIVPVRGLSNRPTNRTSAVRPQITKVSHNSQTTWLGTVACWTGVGSVGCCPREFHALLRLDVGECHSLFSLLEGALPACPASPDACGFAVLVWRNLVASGTCGVAGGSTGQRGKARFLSISLVIQHADSAGLSNQLITSRT